MNNIDFIAIDFETATASQTSICEAGICVVRSGKIIDKQSWLVQPEGNIYNYWNTRIHGITPRDTLNSPKFPEVWEQMNEYIKECPTLVAHNAAFDINCLRKSFELFGIEKPCLNYYCSLRAARKIYDFKCNSLDYLCDVFDISCGTHHRAGDDAEMCARLFLRELRDKGITQLEEMEFCCGTL